MRCWVDTKPSMVLLTTDTHAGPSTGSAEAGDPEKLEKSTRTIGANTSHRSSQRRRSMASAYRSERSYTACQSAKSVMAEP